MRFSAKTSENLVTSRATPYFALVEFLTEFSRYLLAAGISITQFEDAARKAFLSAAATKARLGNQKINQSAVAAMTGLTRVQIRNLLRARPQHKLPPNSRIDRIVAGWISDPIFTTNAGRARVLPLTGRARSFAALTRKYGGDITTRALKAEMLRQGFMRVHGNRASLAVGALRRREGVQLSGLAAALASVLTWNYHTGPKSLKLQTTYVTYETPSGAGRIMLQRRINEALRAFAAQVESAGASVAQSTRRDEQPIRMSKTSFLILSQD